MFSIVQGRMDSRQQEAIRGVESIICNCDWVNMYKAIKAYKKAFKKDSFPLDSFLLVVRDIELLFIKKPDTYLNFDHEISQKSAEFKICCDVLTSLLESCSMASILLGKIYTEVGEYQQALNFIDLELVKEYLRYIVLESEVEQGTLLEKLWGTVGAFYAAFCFVKLDNRPAAIDILEAVFRLCESFKQQNIVQSKFFVCWTGLSLYLLGTLYIAEGKLKEGLTTFNEYLKLKPSGSQFLPCLNEYTRILEAEFVNCDFLDIKTILLFDTEKHL